MANKPRPYCALEKHPNSKQVVCILTNTIWNCAKTCWLELFKNEFSYTTFLYQLNNKIFNRCNIYYLKDVPNVKKLNKLLKKKYNLEIEKRESVKKKIEKEKQKIKLSKKDVQKIITEKARLVNLKPVSKYSKQGILLENYKSIREASISNNLPESNISMCCNGKLKTCGGFKWKFN